MQNTEVYLSSFVDIVDTDAYDERNGIKRGNERRLSVRTEHVSFAVPCAKT